MKPKPKFNFILLFVIGSLFAQRETVGVEFTQHARYIDSLNTQSNILSMNYRNELPSGLRYSISLGLDNVKFLESDTTNISALKSTNQIFLQLEALQKISLMYFKGAAQFYTIDGYATQITSGHSEVLHYNTYRMFEFPIGAGFTFSISDIDLSLGINKTYFYGTNKKEIIVYNSGRETSLGFAPRKTFRSELGFGIEATALYHFSDKLELEVDFIKYEKKDYSLRLSLWGPLRRMIYIK